MQTQERVRLIHGKRDIGVRATEVLLYKGLLPIDENCSNDDNRVWKYRSRSQWHRTVIRTLHNVLQWAHDVIFLPTSGVFCCLLITFANS